MGDGTYTTGMSTVDDQLLKKHLENHLDNKILNWRIKILQELKAIAEKLVFLMKKTLFLS